MAKVYTTVIPAHKNIYTGNPRTLQVHYSFPESGQNENTGILIMMHGLGNHCQSNVSKKMLKQFSDKHNLICIQCNAFGQDFLSRPEKNNIEWNKEDIISIFGIDEAKKLLALPNDNIMEEIISRGSQYHGVIHGNIILPESKEYFCDMGIMQGLDYITALLFMLEKLKKENKKINYGKIIGYGESHGGYMCYLVNALLPGVFTLIIDNSAWLFPGDLYQSKRNIRVVDIQSEGLNINLSYSYLVSKLDINFDFDFAHLSILYSKINNTCKVISFNGVDDLSTLIHEKWFFCQLLDKCDFREITQEHVDGVKIKNTGHGLGADYIHLFNAVMGEKLHFKRKKYWEVPASFAIDTRKNSYQVRYEKGIPNLTIQRRNSGIII